MTATQEISKWIAEFGNERDALNVALARLKTEYERGRQAGLDAIEPILSEMRGRYWNDREVNDLLVKYANQIVNAFAAQPAQEKPEPDIARERTPK